MRKNMIRRVAALLMLLVMMCAALPCQAAGSELEMARITQMAAYIHELATGDLLGYCGLPDSLRNLAASWARGLEGTPRLVVRMDVENAAELVINRPKFVNEHPMVGFEAESTLIGSMMAQMMYIAATQSAVAGADSEEVVLINNSLNARLIYAEEAPEGQYHTGMYIVLYKDACPLMLIANQENGSVSINACFLPSSMLSRCQNAGQVALWFMICGYPMTAEEIPLQ